MPELTAVLLALKLRYFFEFYVRLFGHSSLEEKKKKRIKNHKKRKRKCDCQATEDGSREPMRDEGDFP